MAFRAVIVGIAVFVLGVAVWQVLHPPPPPLELPPFSEQVYLDVEAEWAGEGCLNVVTTTNLPAGTKFSIHSTRVGYYRHGYPYIHKHEELPVVSRRPRMKHQQVFCGISEGYGNEKHAPRLSIQVMGPFYAADYGKDGDPRRLQQARLVGENGELLKGPLASKTVPDPEVRTVATSKTFVLELPKED